MIKISKIDDRTIKVVKEAGGNEKTFIYPALFAASLVDGRITITTEGKWLPNLTLNPVNAEDIYIDGIQQTDAEACVAALNGFIGSFKSGGGGVSPEDLANAIEDIKEYVNESISEAFDSIIEITTEEINELI